MANDGQIVFEVTADGRHAIADIREITRAIQHETRQWDDAAEEATNNINNNFSGMLKKLVAGFSAAKIGKALLDIGKEAISAASDLQEVQNVVDTTFGKSGAAKIESWAKSAGAQFGLTETQAKRFTSTLGAMMKSSGLAGDEIVGMSTDLAGLAADMASFYNLDFDEAFQKIRSGISGETEPLKQLGINMSVANLEAFALEKGLGKTFAQMTQGEQVMLRYQYMMEATADAQGDFARTSDGYANSMRTLETNITSLKTKLGEVLLPAVNDIVGAINGLFGSDAEEKANRFSILDRINEIQINKDAKIEEIKLVASEAQALIDVLSNLGQETGAGAAITEIANGANTLDGNSPANWKAILGALRGIDGLDNLFGNGSNATGTVEELAQALSGNSVSTSKAQAWDIFLSALGNNADAVSKLTGSSVEETKKWIEGMAETAGKLDPADAEAWQTLMGAFTSGIDLNTPEGKSFAETLATEFLAMGTDSAEAAQGLSMLGYSTEEIEEKQAAWLAICKDLRSTIPGISELIDDQTGEIKGGLPALRQYTEEWEKAQKIQAEMDALRQMQDVYNTENNIGTKKGETMSARGTFIVRAQNELGFTEQEAKDLTEFLEAAARSNVDVAMGNYNDVNKDLLSFGDDEERIKATARNLLNVMLHGNKAKEAIAEFYESVDKLVVTEQELPVVNDMINDEMQRLADELGVSVEELQNMTEAEVNAAKGMTLLERAASGEEQAITDVTTAVNNAQEAFTALADHVKSVHDNVLSSINSVANSLNRVEYQSYGKQIEKITELTAKQAQYKVGSDEWKQLQAEIDKVNEGLINTDNIYKNLESQSQFLDDYLSNIRKAREMGLSDALLAQLSDGSVESAQYLDAIVNDKTGKTAAEIDAMYQDVQSKKDALAQELANQQLTVDQTYQALAEKAKEAVAALDLGEEAKENAASTIQGIADGVGEKQEAVANAVNGIITELDRLNGYGINIDFGGFGNITFTTSAGKTEGSGLMGIPLVPHDGYIARLHEGERVLTAQENQIWNALRNGGVAGFDLETLGGVMRDNVKPGGNVYLDGRVVGSVISDQQGKSYRQLQRSGWQS